MSQSSFASPSGHGLTTVHSVKDLTKREWKTIADKTGWITTKFNAEGCVFEDDEGKVQKISHAFGRNLLSSLSD